MMNNFPSLYSERLLLRELTNEDLLPLFAIHRDSAAMQWFGSDTITDLRGVANMIAVFAGWRTAPDPGTRWGIERLSDGKLLGTCGLFKWNRNWQSCTIGYELGRDYWGQGYMQEALGLAIAWGLQEMRLHRIDALIHPDNLPSRRLSERLGFVEEGLLREAGFWNGEFHDLVQYGLLRQDFL